jgi:uncharacterized protein (DUF924 family)
MKDYKNTYRLFFDYWFGTSTGLNVLNDKYDLWWDLGAIHAKDWKNNPIRDQEIEKKFGYLFEEMKAKNLEHWLTTPKGYLAYVLVADLLPRCFLRGTKSCYIFEKRTRELVLLACEKGFDKEISRIERAFFYMPLTHSEEEQDQVLSCQKYEELRAEWEPDGINDAKAELFFEGFLYSAKRHHLVFGYFKRFPNRNEILGRQSTTEEKRYLNNPWEFFKNGENEQ